MPPRWDSDEMRSPAGLPESELERRAAWLMRAGLVMPEWCARDPRLSAPAAVLAAALDSLADDDGLVMATPAIVAKLLRLLPSEVAMRFDAALERLIDVGIIEHAAGGYLLFRDGLDVGEEPEEWSDEALLDWARGLPDGGAAVRETLLGNGTPTPETTPAKPALRLVKGGVS